MRRLIILALLVALIGGASLAASAPQASLETLRIGFPNVPGLSTVDGNGNLSGLVYDWLIELSKYTNWQYSFVFGDANDLLSMLIRGELDLMGGIAYSQTLDGPLAFPRYSAGLTYAVLVAAQDNAEIQRDDIRSMQQRTIAADPSAAETQRLLSFLALNNINCTIHYAAGQQAIRNLLEKGEVDMALMPSEAETPYRIITRFAVEPYYIAASGRRADLVDVLNAAFSLILEADPAYPETLYANYFEGGTASDLVLSDEEKAYVAGAETLRVAVSDDWEPLHFFNADGMPEGISVDILNLVAERTGLPLAYVRADTFEAAMAMLDGGQADMALGVPVGSVGVNGESDIVMTRPYLDMYRVAVINNYSEYPAEDLRLALMPGMDFLMDAQTGEVVYADTFEACMELVNTGAADYAYGTSYLVEHAAKQRQYHNVQMLTIPENSEQMAIGLRRPVDPALLTTLNKALMSITEETLQDVVLHNTVLHEQEQTLQSIIYAYPLLVVALLSVLTLLVVVCAVVITLLRARHSRALFRTQYTDDLTGALNLAGFRREASRLLQEDGVNWAIFYGTIKGFQFINDRYGYEEGDFILRRIADLYRADILDGEIFCRVSGGTFVAMRRYETEDALIRRLNRFHEHLYKITPHNDQGYHVHMADGVYFNNTAGGNRGDVFAMMDRANLAQRQIKRSSERNYIIYKDDVYDSMMHAGEIEGRMEAALEAGDFVVYLQPKYDLTIMRPGGAEALVRWIDKGRVIPPGEFIPQFERNGFVARLDRHVFTECCRMLRRWMDTGRPVVPVSVNVSRVQLYAPDFIEKYVEIKARYDIPDGLIELEFTESILFEDVTGLITIVEALHKNGFECSIDDFGKGYSSLTMLKNIPADVIKLDAQFFETGIDEARDTIIIENVVGIAKSLSMVSVAEGIENDDQVRLLRKIGCDMAQGYVFARPMDIAAFEAYLDDKLTCDMDPCWEKPGEWFYSKAFTPKHEAGA